MKKGCPGEPGLAALRVRTVSFWIALRFALSPHRQYWPGKCKRKSNHCLFLHCSSPCFRNIRRQPSLTLCLRPPAATLTLVLPRSDLRCQANSVVTPLYQCPPLSADRQSGRPCVSNQSSELMIILKTLPKVSQISGSRRRAGQCLSGADPIRFLFPSDSLNQRFSSCVTDSTHHRGQAGLPLPAPEPVRCNPGCH